MVNDKIISNIFHYVFSHSLSEIRRDCGLSINKMAKVLRIPRTTLSYLEKLNFVNNSVNGVYFRYMVVFYFEELIFPEEWSV